MHLVQGPSLSSPTDGMPSVGTLLVVLSDGSTVFANVNAAHIQWMILTPADLQAKVVVSCTGIATCWPSVYTQPLLA